jgi:hypothetical protein
MNEQKTDPRLLLGLSLVALAAGVAAVVVVILLAQSVLG